MVNIPLGQILKAQGAITESQLIEAIKRKSEDMEGKKLGDVLIELGYISEIDLIKALSKRLQLAIVDYEIPRVPENIISLIPENVARQWEVVPIDLKEGKVVVAMNDPLNYQAIDDIRIVAQKEVVPMLATKSNIQQALNKFYADKQAKNLADDMNTNMADLSMDQADEEALAMEARIDNTPVVKIISTIVSQSFAKGASDIHMEPHEDIVKIRLRIDGGLVDYMDLKPNVYRAVLTRIKIMSDMNIAEKRIPQDGRFSYQVSPIKKVDVRVSTLPMVHGEKTVMRILGGVDSKLRTLKELGMSQHNLQLFDQIIKNPNGVILMTGPTGSGKSTTLYSILGTVAKPDLNVTTVEDPVEMEIRSINQVQVNHKAGLTFAAALRSILRQDPDIVMIGEIRDSETVEIAIRAAITGHLVLSTLHTNDAASTITRLIDMGAEDYLVASSVVGVVAQRLVRKICPHCKALRPITEEERLVSGLDDVNEVAYGKGCEKCNGTGYHSRTAIHEILVVDDKMRQMITSNATNEQLREYAKSRGTLTLKDNMQILVKEKITTVEELVKVAYSID